jgi:hypothetical protein
MRPMVERVSGRVRMEVAARTSGRCRVNSLGACHLLLRENRQEDHVVGIRTAHDLADTGGRNALDDEQVAALFPFAQVCRDAVQRAEVRSILLPVWKGLEPGAPTLAGAPRLRLLVVRGELHPVLRDEHGKQPCRLGRARVLAHRMGGPRRLEPALAGLVDRDRTVIHLGANRALEHVGDDRPLGRVVVRPGAAGAYSTRWPIIFCPGRFGKS